MTNLQFSLWHLICFVLYLFVVVDSKCPNSCSGHGSCGTANICTCFNNWNGGAADCSQRICPNGTAWFDKAFATDSAHQIVECSNSGICDRSSGNCQCFPGYTGAACQRSVCPNDCSGHGTCSMINDVALFSGPDYDSTKEFSGDGLGAVYSNWDKSSIQMCECDRGYFGPDCTLLMCPRGDDPMTINQNYREVFINVQTGSSHVLSGHMGFNFQGETVYIDLTRPSSDACTKALAFHGQFGHAKCTIEILTPFQFSFTMAFYSWPLLPRGNNLYSHDGNPSRYDFYCDMSAASPLAFCEFTDIHASNIREYVYCSNRGNCDFSTGLCTCQKGYGGAACSNETYVYSEPSGNLPSLAVNANNLHYTSQVVRVTAKKSKAPDFDLISASAGGEQVFSVMGDGTVNINSLRTLTGGQTVSGNGLFVKAGGVTITGDGLNVYTYVADGDPVVTINSLESSALPATYTAFKVQSRGSNPNTHYLAQFMNQDKKKVDIRADGNMFIRGGGLVVSSAGITVASSGMKIAVGGLTVTSGGLSINGGGAAITGGVTVSNSGLKVMSGGVFITGGVTVFTSGLKVRAGGVGIVGGLTTTGGVSVANSGFAASGGLTIFNGGVRITGGLTVTNNGMVITTSGLRVNDGGVTITTKGMTILNGGVIVSSSGLSIGGSGLLITTGGLTVYQGGLTVTGGLTVVRDTLIVTDGMTIKSLGLTISGGLTVNDLGLSTFGGLSVTGGLLTVTGGIGATGGFTVHDTGLIITGGMTINSGDLTVNENLIVYGGLSVGGSTPGNMGLHVSGGLTVWGTVDMEASSFIVFSDRRLKTNMLPIRNALDKVNKLQGVYFNWIQNEPTGLNFDANRHVGVIAQDVMAVLPEVVEQKHQGLYLGVDYAAIIPLLIEAIHDIDELITQEEKNAQKVDKELESERVADDLHQQQMTELEALRKDAAELFSANQALLADMQVFKREMIEARERKAVKNETAVQK